MGKATCFQTEKAQKPYSMGLHKPIWPYIREYPLPRYSQTPHVNKGIEGTTESVPPYQRGVHIKRVMLLKLKKKTFTRTNFKEVKEDIKDRQIKLL